MDRPETKYARSGDVNIAYQVTGDGPTDIVYVPSVAHHVELNWENQLVARFFVRLAGLGRLILFDKRGTGMSDRVSDFPTLETRMDDIRAVMDAVNSESAAVFASGEGGPLGMLFAATYPERTAGLVLFNATPRFTRSAELPWLSSRGQYEAIVDEVSRRWGEAAFNEEFARRSNPEASDAEISAFARVFRLSVSPGAAAHYMRMNADVDVSDVLSSIRVPTLIVHSAPPSPTGRSVARENAQFFVSRIPDARIVELPGRNFGPPLVDQNLLFAELERFVAAAGERETDEPEGPERVLATVLFTDIVGATAKASELGDRHWRELLEQHHAQIRALLSRFRGVELDTAGDGFFARFDGPARAIRCATAIREAVGELGLEVRAGLHTGECELLNGKVAGIAVSIGARVAAEAAAGQVLVSSTVKDLVAGSGIEFEDQGVRQLKGVPGEWRLFAVRAG